MDGRSAAVVIFGLLACCLATAQEMGAPNRERYKLRENSHIGGLLLGTEIGNAVWVLPFDKPYAALTKDQQTMVRSQYEQMSESDEPPYPIDGLGSIYDPVARAQQRLLVKGQFYAMVEVDAIGQPTAVAIHRTPSAKVSKFVAAIILATKFKPALCDGTPCSMGFPVRVEFQ